METTNANAPGQGGVSGNYESEQTRLSASPIREVKREFPDPRHLPGRVLAILLSGRRFTHKDAWMELGHSRLSDSIWKLRRIGWPVQMTEELVPTSDGDRQATIGVYFLSADVIAASGERGQHYASECQRIAAERKAA